MYFGAVARLQLLSLKENKTALDRELRGLAVLRDVVGAEGHVVTVEEKAHKGHKGHKAQEDKTGQLGPRARTG